jgi:hypothetical protein
MSPILGIIASSKLVASNSYESIASASGTGSSGTITFSSFPSTYKHLQLRGVAIWSSNFDVLQLRFNGDTGSNYASHHLMGDGSSAIASGLASQSRIRLSADGYSFSNGVYTPLIIDIADYASTTKTKTVRIFLGAEQNTTPRRVLLASGLWNSTSAITSVSLSTQSASNFTTETLISLYGIKG